MPVSPAEADGVAAYFVEVFRFKSFQGHVRQYGKREWFHREWCSLSLAERAGTGFAEVVKRISARVAVVPIDDEAFGVFREGDGFGLGHNYFSRMIEERSQVMVTSDRNPSISPFGSCGTPRPFNSMAISRRGPYPCFFWQKLVFNRLRRTGPRNLQGKLMDYLTPS